MRIPITVTGLSAFLSLSGVLWLLGCMSADNDKDAGVKPSTRTYFIAAEEKDWNYAPAGKDLMTGSDFDSIQEAYTVPGQTRIGRIFKKALYREYTDSSFSKPKDIDEAWKHLGILGPAIRAQVGDTIRVVFRNKSATRPYSMHPHGVFYDKASEGMGMPAMDSTMEFRMGIAAPGATITYTWPVPPRAGPGPADGSSVLWLYHSHVDEPKDVNSGLVGPIIITAAGKMRSDGRPLDVDREFVALFTIFNENLSWYLDENILKSGAPDSVNKDDDYFKESNLKHSMNGYLYSNLPGLEMRKGERVRWYLMGMGTETDIHTPHWHGNTLLVNGHRADVGELFPATTAVYDMIPDDPGTWMFHCHVNDHIVAGMVAQYTVVP